MSKLYFRHSPMNSGKSTHLMQTAYNYEERGMKPLLVTSGIDVRHGKGMITSRLGLKKEAVVIEKGQSLIGQLANYLHSESIDAIFVDEVQFLTANQIEDLAYIVDVHNIPVFCYGLRSDFKSELFEGSKRLFELADSITELKNICSCGRKAIMNKRLIDSQEQFVLGDEKIYDAVCRVCFKRRK